ncbi:MAG: hypothetical protein OEX07_11495, partial [Gammaproteobacteria bacterium]|nr:hypothetical protein [Gammaproteobacteria bacterium]
DINESLNILEKGVLVDHLPKEPKAEPNTKVADNIGALGIPVFSLNENVYETDITLIPGQVHQIFVETDKNTHDVIVSVDEFVAQLPEENQNSIFGDEFILTVADSQLSTDHIILDELVKKPETFIVSHPQPGLVRVAFLGDWTNAGLVSAKISVRRVNEQPLMPILTGTIADGETKVFKFNVDPAVEFVSFGLSWINDWSYYPSHDLDIIVIDPNGNSNFRGASLHSPEFVGIEAPTPGVWTVKVDGFLLHEFSEDYQLSVNDQNGDPILLVYQ